MSTEKTGPQGNFDKKFGITQADRLLNSDLIRITDVRGNTENESVYREALSNILATPKGFKFINVVINNPHSNEVPTIILDSSFHKPKTTAPIGDNKVIFNPNELGKDLYLSTDGDVYIYEPERDIVHGFLHERFGIGHATPEGLGNDTDLVVKVENEIVSGIPSIGGMRLTYGVVGLQTKEISESKADSYLEAYKSGDLQLDPKFIDQIGIRNPTKWELYWQQEVGIPGSDSRIDINTNMINSPSEQKVFKDILGIKVDLSVSTTTPQLDDGKQQTPENKTPEQPDNTPELTPEQKLRDLHSKSEEGQKDYLEKIFGPGTETNINFNQPYNKKTDKYYDFQPAPTEGYPDPLRDPAFEIWLEQNFPHIDGIPPGVPEDEQSSTNNHNEPEMVFAGVSGIFSNLGKASPIKIGTKNNLDLSQAELEHHRQSIEPAINTLRELERLFDLGVENQLNPLKQDTIRHEIINVSSLLHLYAASTGTNIKEHINIQNLSKKVGLFSFHSSEDNSFKKTTGISELDNIPEFSEFAKDRDHKSDKWSSQLREKFNLQTTTDFLNELNDQIKTSLPQNNEPLPKEADLTDKERIDILAERTPKLLNKITEGVDKDVNPELLKVAHEELNTQLGILSGKQQLFDDLGPQFGVDTGFTQDQINQMSQKSQELSDIISNKLEDGKTYEGEIGDAFWNTVPNLPSNSIVTEEWQEWKDGVRGYKSEFNGKYLDSKNIDIENEDPDLIKELPPHSKTKPDVNPDKDEDFPLDGPGDIPVMPIPFNPEPPASGEEKPIPEEKGEPSQEQKEQDEKPREELQPEPVLTPRLTPEQREKLNEKLDQIRNMPQHESLQWKIKDFVPEIDFNFNFLDKSVGEWNVQDWSNALFTVGGTSALTAGVVSAPAVVIGGSSLAAATTLADQGESLPEVASVSNQASDNVGNQASLSNNGVDGTSPAHSISGSVSGSGSGVPQHNPFSTNRDSVLSSNDVFRLPDMTISSDGGMVSFGPAYDNSHLGLDRNIEFRTPSDFYAYINDMNNLVREELGQEYIEYLEGLGDVRIWGVVDGDVLPENSAASNALKDPILLSAGKKIDPELPVKVKDKDEEIEKYPNIYNEGRPGKDQYVDIDWDGFFEAVGWVKDGDYLAVIDLGEKGIVNVGPEFFTEDLVHYLYKHKDELESMQFIMVPDAYDDIYNNPEQALKEADINKDQIVDALELFLFMFDTSKDGKFDKDDYGYHADHLIKAAGEGGTTDLSKFSEVVEYLALDNMGKSTVCVGDWHAFKKTNFKKVGETGERLAFAIGMDNDPTGVPWDLNNDPNVKKEVRGDGWIKYTKEDSDVVVMIGTNKDDELTIDDPNNFYYIFSHSGNDNINIVSAKGWYIDTRNGNDNIILGGEESELTKKILESKSSLLKAFQEDPNIIINYKKALQEKEPGFLEAFLQDPDIIFKNLEFIQHTTTAGHNTDNITTKSGPPQIIYPARHNDEAVNDGGVVLVSLGSSSELKDGTPVSDTFTNKKGVAIVYGDELPFSDNAIIQQKFTRYDPNIPENRAAFEEIHYRLKPLIEEGKYDEIPAVAQEIVNNGNYLVIPLDSKLQNGETYNVVNKNGDVVGIPEHILQHIRNNGFDYRGSNDETTNLDAEVFFGSTGRDHKKAGDGSAADKNVVTYAKLGDGEDTFTSKGGINVVEGNNHIDHFEFLKNSETHNVLIIEDFGTLFKDKKVQESIAIKGFSDIKSFEDVQNKMVPSDNGTIIHLDDNNKIVLENVQIKELNSASFSFGDINTEVTKDSDSAKSESSTISYSNEGDSQFNQWAHQLPSGFISNAYASDGTDVEPNHNVTKTPEISIFGDSPAIDPLGLSMTLHMVLMFARGIRNIKNALMGTPANDFYADENREPEVPKSLSYETAASDIKGLSQLIVNHKNIIAENISEFTEARELQYTGMLLGKNKVTEQANEKLDVLKESIANKIEDNSLYEGYRLADYMDRLSGIMVIEKLSQDIPKLGSTEEIWDKLKNENTINDKSITVRIRLEKRAEDLSTQIKDKSSEQIGETFPKRIYTIKNINKQFSKKCISSIEHKLQDKLPLNWIENMTGKQKNNTNGLGK